MPDSNDIVYDGYQVDFFFIGRQFFDIFGFESFTYVEFVSFVQNLWQTYVVIALIVSFFLAIGIVYAYIRYNQMSELETIMVQTQDRLYQELYGKDSKNSRWDEVQEHIASTNPNDWKLAIIEADVMLEQALDDAGYAGSTVGEKLKSASPTNLQSLNDAWTAHKVRNAIAHSHTDFILTQKLAQQTVVQYGNVFRELGVM